MKKRGWEIPDREATSEDVYMNRRRFMKAAGATGIGAVGLLAGCGSEAIFTPAETPEVTPPTPADTRYKYAHDAHAHNGAAVPGQGESGI